MTATVDRRAFRRRPAPENRTLLEWWDGPETRTTASRFVNISPGGALLAADAPPPAGHRVWFRMVEPASTAWVVGRVVRVDEAGSVGISFPEPCPRDVFEAAVQGIGFGNVLGAEATARG